ncbi:MAG: outer membrane lipoprotein-sorting protein [Gammaproteobacteria bacterium]|nr:outer membrane lipoprotein-sorting protein [Gammaproteobacteria bacterium]
MKGIILLFNLVAFSGVVFAETAEEKGLAIAIEADKRDQGWGDQATTSKMILRNSQGATSTREIRGKALEVKGDGDKSLTIFNTPRDVKGTAFLSFTHTLKADEQWLYLPALKRVKRISSSNKSGPFMGSEFAYEDISSQEVGKYKYKFIKDDKFNGRDVFVMERYPQYKKSGYTKQVAWIDKEMYQPLKIEFYDRKKSLLKTLTQHDYKQYQNKFWRPGRLEMVNHQTGKSTTLLWKSYKFNNGFKSRDFDRNSLKRAR